MKMLNLRCFSNLLLVAYTGMGLSAYMPYQDILVDGKEIKSGYGPSCAVRYKAIKDVLLKNGINKKITVLDIGAATGYFSFKLAQEFKADCTMIESDSRIERLLQRNSLVKNLHLIAKRVNVNDLKQMAKNTQYDVVLALNVIHHFGDQWQDAADAILHLGKFVFIETPPAGVSKKQTINAHLCGAIDKYIRSLGGSVICTVPRWSDKGLFENIYLLKSK